MILELLLRWGHVFAAVALAGGIWFWCSAVHPALGTASAELLSALRRRWAPLVGITSAVLLATGLINAIRNIQQYDLPGWYHAAVAVKLVIGLALFFLAAKLTGRSASAVKMQQQSGKWLAICSILAIVLVGLGGLMKVAPHVPHQTAVDAMPDLDSAEDSAEATSN